MMQKLSLIPALLVASVMELAMPSETAAQQPKMDIKLFAGVSGTTYVSMLETGRERDTFAGWQAGFGARVHRRKWFLEVLFSFNRWAFSQSTEEAGFEGTLKGRVNSFELPFNGGFIPYQNAYFKLFLYAGYVNHFNTKILASVEQPGEPTVSDKLRPKEIDLAIYQALARFGINFDIAMFNIDFNYSISMNSATSTSYRTGYHQLQLNLAYLF
ncbi:MAG: hypothetical protein WAU39_06935 [Polyangiales bacterium]